MCKVGDIIVIEEYIGEDGTVLPKHSFVVIDDTADEIKGLKYDFVANVMSSFKNDAHKAKKLRFKENLAVTSDDIESQTTNARDGYIKADQLHYFDKSRIDYYVLASINTDLLDELIRLIIELEVEDKLKQNTKNIEIKEEVSV